MANARSARISGSQRTAARFEKKSLIASKKEPISRSAYGPSAQRCPQHDTSLGIRDPGVALERAQQPARVAFVLGAFAASLSWQTTLAGGGSVLHRLPPRAHLWTGVAGAAVALAFALRTALGAL